MASFTKIEIIVIANMPFVLVSLIIIAAKRNRTDENAWILKYLIMALDEDSFISWNSQINPTNLNKFSSIINQTVNNE